MRAVLLSLVTLAGCDVVFGLHSPATDGGGAPHDGSGASDGSHHPDADGPDEDGDGFANADDRCPTVADDQQDSDGDGVGNACEVTLDDNAAPDHIFAWTPFDTDFGPFEAVVGSTILAPTNSHIELTSGNALTSTASTIAFRRATVSFAFQGTTGPQEIAIYMAGAVKACGIRNVPCGAGVGDACLVLTYSGDMDVPVPFAAVGDLELSFYEHALPSPGVTCQVRTLPNGAPVTVGVTGGSLGAGRTTIRAISSADALVYNAVLYQR